MMMAAIHLMQSLRQRGSSHWFQSLQTKVANNIDQLARSRQGPILGQTLQEVAARGADREESAQARPCEGEQRDAPKRVDQEATGMPTGVQEGMGVVGILRSGS